MQNVEIKVRNLKMEAKENIKEVEEPITSKNPALSTYNKNHIFNYLNLYGCSEASQDIVLDRFKISKQNLCAFLNDLIQKAELYLYQECSSNIFDNIQAWLEIIQMFDLSVPSKPFALCLETIASNEPLPTPDEINGINLRAIYQFLSNAMLGLPQPALDDATAEFLSNELKDLVKAINNETGDDIVNAIFKLLFNFPPPNYNCDYLDPFALNQSHTY